MPVYSQVDVLDQKNGFNYTVTDKVLAYCNIMHNSMENAGLAIVVRRLLILILLI